MLLPVLTNHGAGAVFTVVAVAMGLLVLEVGVLGTRTTGRSVDQAGEPTAVYPDEAGTRRSSRRV